MNRLARQLRRNLASRRGPKRGSSLQVESGGSFSSSTASSANVSATNTGISVDHHGRQAAFNESPDSTFDFDYSHTASTGDLSNVAHRGQKGSLDDIDLDTVRYVEKETGKDAVRRDEDLSPRHSRAPSKA